MKQKYFIALAFLINTYLTFSQVQEWGTPVSGITPVMGSQDSTSLAPSVLSGANIVVNSNMQMMVSGLPTGSSSEVGITHGELSVSTSGNAKYQIPIAVPPGINDIVPTLSLVYNSGAGNGIAGYGWNVDGISVISRVATPGYLEQVIDPVDFDLLDRYALDGEKLLLKSGVYGANEAIYETESYSNIKIVSHGISPFGPNYGPSSFTVFYPDGSKAYYGNVANTYSRGVWAISYWENAAGIRITYNYNYSAVNNDLTIASIKYGSRGSATPINEIQFVYNSRLRPEQAYIGGANFTRNTILKEIRVLGNGMSYRTYTLGFDTTSLNYQRLISVTEKVGVKALNPTLFTYNDTSEQLVYSQSPTSLAVQNISIPGSAVVPSDFDDNGKMDFILYPTASSVKNKYWIFNNWDSPGVLGFEHNIGTFEDIFDASYLGGNSSIGFKLNPKRGWCVVRKVGSLYNFEMYSYGTANPIYYQYNVTATPIGSAKHRFVSGDFNGDGLSDVIMLMEGSKTAKFVNLDKRLTSSQVITGSINIALSSSDKVFTGDVNGDGKADLIQVKDGYVWVYNLNSQNNLVLLFRYDHLDIVLTRSLLIGDFNGDGKTDFMIPKGYGSSYALFKSLGSSFVHSLESYPDMEYRKNSSTNTYHLIPTDLNNDGKTDILAVNNIYELQNLGQYHGRINVTLHKNTSTGFAVESSATTGYQSNIKANAVPIFLGSDRATQNLTAAFISHNQIHEFKSSKNFAKEKLLRTVRTGMGVTETVHYSPLEHAEPANQYNVEYPYTADISLTDDYPMLNIINASSVNLVSKIEVESTDAIKRKFFKYFGATGDVSGKGFLGFKAVLSTNWHNDNYSIISTITHFDVTKNSLRTDEVSLMGIGLPSYMPSSPPFIKRSSFVYDYEVFLNGVYRTQLINEYHTNGLTDTNVFAVNAYNGYNLLESKSVSYISGATTEKTETHTFSYDNSLAVPYYVGRLAQVNSSTTANGDTMTSETKYIYNAEQQIVKSEVKGHLTDYITTDFEYEDANLNLTKKTVSAPGVPNRIALFEYDSVSNRFLTKSTDALGLETTYTYNQSTGDLLTETDPYGRTTSYEYDVWGKITKVTDYLNNNSTYTYSKPTSTTAQVIFLGPDGYSTLSRYDDLGREIIAGQKNFNATWSYVKTAYDIYDRKISISEPYPDINLMASQFNTVHFDGYGRPSQTVDYTGRTTVFDYDGLKVTETVTASGVTQTRTVTHNSAGDVVKRTDNGGEILYQYFANGNLKQSNYDGIIVSVEQDGWGRRKKLTDPSGNGAQPNAVYQYNYNNFGELMMQSTPKGAATFTYNTGGQILTRSLTGVNNNYTTTYGYNPSTKLLESETHLDGNNGISTTISYQYDTYKRLSQIDETRQDGQFTFGKTYEYDPLLGRLLRERYNASAAGKTSSKWIKYGHSNGYRTSISSDDGTAKLLWQANNVNVRGQLTQETFGNDLMGKITYDAFGRPTQIKYYKPGTIPTTPGGELPPDPVPDVNILVLGYNTNAQRGNLLSRSNSAFNWNESFTYDSLDRLTQFTNSKALSETQTYDDKGRIQTNSLGSYNYNSDRPYQASSLEPSSEAMAYYVNREGVYHDGLEEKKGWAIYEPTAITYDSQHVKTGDFAIKINNTGTNEKIVISEKWIAIDNPVATEYEFSAWVYSTGPETEMFLYMKNANETGDYSSVSSTVTSVTNQWIKLEKLVTIPASVKWIKLRVDANTSGSAWFDDFVIQKTSVMPTPDRQLNVVYNGQKAPVTIEEPGIDKLSFDYLDGSSRSILYYGGVQADKLTRPLRKYYSAIGDMEIKRNMVSGAVEFISYLGGDGYDSPVAYRTNGTSGDYLYLHRDYQGSILSITGDNANVLETRHFDAWGNLIGVKDFQGKWLSQMTLLDRGYTGHEHLQTIGIVHMNGRLYDPKLHRFLQPDNYIQDIGNTQNYNRYSYVLNNPLKYIDPSGENYDGPYYGGPINPYTTEYSGGGLSNSQQSAIGNFIRSIAESLEGRDIAGWFERNFSWGHKIGKAVDPIGNFFDRAWDGLGNMIGRGPSKSPLLPRGKYTFASQQINSNEFLDVKSFGPGNTNGKIQSCNSWSSVTTAALGNNTVSTGKTINDYAGLGFTGIETVGGSFRVATARRGFSPKYYRNAWTGNQYATTYNLGKIGRGLGSTATGVGILLDLKGVQNYYNPKIGPNSPNSVSLAKAGLNTGMAAYGIRVNPIPALLYSVIDMFYPGGWTGNAEAPGLAKDQDRLDKENKAINPSWQLWPGAMKQ